MEPMTTYPGVEKEEEWLSKWVQWWDLLENVKREQVDANDVRCPEPVAMEKMREVLIVFIAVFTATRMSQNLLATNKRGILKYANNHSELSQLVMPRTLLAAP
jgi:hypothetical protein